MAARPGDLVFYLGFLPKSTSRRGRVIEVINRPKAPNGLPFRPVLRVAMADVEADYAFVEDTADQFVLNAAARAFPKPKSGRNKKAL